MKATHSILLFAIVTASLFAVGREAAPAQSEAPKPEKNPGKRPASLPGGGADPFAGLSPEQREKLRESVRRAWNDPEVIQARDELKAATDAYQNALKTAIDRSDPDSAKLIEKFREISQSESKGYLFPGGGSNGRSGPPALQPGSGPRDLRDFEGFLTMENPAFLRDLDDGKKRLYREAHRRAMESPEVKKRFEHLKSLRHEDEEVRKKRTDAIRGMHVALRQALVEADPRVAEFLPVAESRKGGGNAEGAEPKEKEPKKKEGGE